MVQARTTKRELNPNAKLTIFDVSKIRGFPYKLGLYTTLAKKYKMSSQNVRSVYLRDTWKDCN